MIAYYMVKIIFIYKRKNTFHKYAYCSLFTVQGSPRQGPSLDRDPQAEISWTETPGQRLLPNRYPLDRDPLDNAPPLGQRHPVDRQTLLVTGVQNYCLFSQSLLL